MVGVDGQAGSVYGSVHGLCMGSLVGGGGGFDELVDKLWQTIHALVGGVLMMSSFQGDGYITYVVWCYVVTL